MKLRIVLASLESAGGMVHYVSLLAGEFAAAGHEVHVIVLEGDGVRELFDAKVQLHVQPWPDGRGKRWILQTISFSFVNRLVEQVLMASPEIVHLVYGGPWALQFSRRLVAAGIPVVVTVHDPTPHEERLSLQSRVLRWYMHWQLKTIVRRYATAVHVHSDLHRQEVVRLFDSTAADRTYVVPHGLGGVPIRIAKGKERPPELQAWEPEDVFTVLLFGRLHPYKGIEYLCKAAKLVAAQGVPIRLIIAGRGTVPDDCKWTCCTVINRFIRDEEVRSLFELCDVVALPYISATQSGVIGLAYAFGRPVLATRVGALPEAIVEGETGFIVPPGDVAALAEALKRLSNRDLSRAMGENAKCLVDGPLGWRNVAQRHVSQYERIVSRDFLKSMTVLRSATSP